MAQTARVPARPLGALLVVGCSLAVSAAWAAVPKEQAGAALEAKAFFRPELYISTSHVPLESVLVHLPSRTAWEGFLAARGEDPATPRTRIYVDPRSGAASNLIGSFPLIPGDGAGNQLTLATLRATLAAPVQQVDGPVVANALRLFVNRHRGVLAIDTQQLGAARTTQVNADLWQVSIPQEVGGIPVRHARLAASISHGNLVVIGTETWGDVRIDTAPKLGADEAMAAGFAFVDGRSAEDTIVRAPQLEIVPTAPPELQHGEGFGGPVGSGYRHRLVWTFVFQRSAEDAQWELMVDAHSGEVLSLLDLNQYEERRVTGGVYPLTSTGICPNPGQCGTMQTGWPMPFADTGLAAPNNFTNSAGVFDWTAGTVATTLTGRFVDIVDTCGAVNESSSTGNINLGGANNQHDCTSGGASAGNTPASRSAFYEVNRIAELARGWLPSNTWLQSRLTTNVNLNQTCNAFWNGSSINFFRSGGGCRNTGEIAGVFDHEWGHGLDDNDTAGGLSNSSEAYADIAAIYRLQTSCVGHGFFQTLNQGCGQTVDGTGFNSNENQVGGSHCALDCSGVRDADWDKHADHQPDTALGFVCTQCANPGIGQPPGPCGKQVHCSAAPSRQAAWDLVARDLQSAPFNLDSQTAFIIGNKLFYQGSGNIGAWHACTCGSTSSGCGATNGYMQWLTADDDNGNLNDGTPHMTAIFNAFNRHGIACSTPTAQNGGCAAGPTAAPTNLTATPGDFQVALSWTGAAGATRYWVFRSDGHAGCNFGKTKIAEVTGTTFTDTQVANGRAYSYNVVAAGASAACFGRASTCVTATPNAPTNPDFSISCSPSSLSVQQGGQSGTSTCTVSSQNGFSSPVTLSCEDLPNGAGCGFNPNPVTPPANGSANSALIISAAATTPTGTSNFLLRAIGGSLNRSFSMSVTVTAPNNPDFSISCSPSSLSVQQGGQSGTSTCTVSSQNGFNGPVNLSCEDLPTGASCSFNPNPVTPPANGSANSALIISAAATTPTGTFPFLLRAIGGSLNRSFSMSVTVTGTGGGGQTASFDPVLQAPKCATVGNSCDAGPTLLLGRDGRGPEPNQPNTINDSCADGTSGTFHSDESNDRIVVATTDGTSFAPGKTVRITATVWAWTTPSADKLDLYYAANANSPAWTFVTTLTPTVAGSQTLSATYTLPSGALQAVRARFRYQGSASPCAAGSYTDHDDLVFAANAPSEVVVFTDDFETEKGWTRNPSGTDTATTGLWVRGDPEQTDSSGPKQLGTTTSGVNDLVTGRLAGTGAGADDIDGGVTTIRSPAITLPASGTLTLTFRYYLAHGTNSSSADFLRVRVVGATTSTVFEELGAANDDDAVWATHTASLNAFAGQTVRILIEAADASTASLVEAAVDDVRITQQ